MRWCKALLTCALAVLACNADPSPKKRESNTARTTDTPKAVSPPDAVKTPPVGKDGTVYAEIQQMGTRVSFKIWLGTQNAVAAGEAIGAATTEIERIENIMSEWRPKSEISRFNRTAGETVQVGEDLFNVLQRGQKVSEATDGHFDVTFHAVGQLWTFTEGSKPPDAAAIEEQLALVGWRKLILDAEARTGRLEQPGMMIGLGAIAKGYAVDRAAALLREHGFPDHIIEAGGDTYVSGSKGGKDWIVGVQNPDGPGIVGALPARDEAVVTSGDYQRFFEYEGKRYAHILDPRTGWPVEPLTAPKGVTLIAPNATDADAYATAMSVMRVDKGMAVVESRPELEIVIITRDDQIRISSGLAGRFVPTPRGAPDPRAPDQN